MPAYLFTNYGEHDFSELRIAPGPMGLLSIVAIILFIGGVYYVTARKKGVTLSEAIFNWPLVFLAGVVTFLALL